MTRDWHATYLTDPRVMDAAGQRAARHGDDGWAAAYTLALTMPPAPGSHEAVGARDVLVPDTLPDRVELDRLEADGYYDDPNIGSGNPDMSASMIRRARPGEAVRPDLRCPRCCVAAGCEDEAGMPEQVYRCTECRELWEYRAPWQSSENWVILEPGTPYQIAFERLQWNFGHLTGWFDLTGWLGCENTIAHVDIRNELPDDGSAVEYSGPSVDELREVREFVARDLLPLGDTVSMAGMQTARRRGLVVGDSLDRACSAGRMVISCDPGAWSESEIVVIGEQVGVHLLAGDAS